VLRRVIAIVIMLFAISIVTFLLFFAIPRDPARLTCGKVCTPQLIAQNRHTLGYDRSVATQYRAFLKGLVVSRDFPDDPQLKRTHPELITHCRAPCLGYSPSQQTTVNNVMGRAAPVTLSLILGGFVLWIVFGVGLGVLSAVRRGKNADKVVLGVSLIGYSFPTFFVGLILYDVVYGILNQPRLDVSAAICTETLRDLWMVYEWKLADLRKQAAAKYVSYETLALLSAKLSLKGETLHYLEKTYEEHEPKLVKIQSEPDFDFLHADPRYRAIIRKMDLAPAW